MTSTYKCANYYISTGRQLSRDANLRLTPQASRMPEAEELQ